jgi:ketosteroid isomerase-like protein
MSTTTWEQDIRASEEENRVAFLAADLRTLDRLWTDDFLVNSPLNLVNDKAGTFGLLEAGRIRHTSMAFEIERMTCQGEVVVVMGRDQVTDAPHEVVTRRRFTNLWRREAGAWRCFARHANVVERVPAG